MKRLKSMLGFLLSFCMIAVMIPVTTLSYATDIKSKADIVFVIDSTGSMGDEISGVRNNLTSFTQILEDAGVNFQIAIIDYKDITVSGERESTRILANDSGSIWFTHASEVSDILSSISVNGGGDGPESAVDALGCMISGKLNFREDASKFSILLTDASFKEENDYSYEDMDSLINSLISTGVSTSVISDTSLETTYHNLYSKTDGIFCDIYGNFAEKLAEIASYIEDVVNPVEIHLSTEAGAWTSIAQPFKLTATITSTDSEKDVTDLSVNLTLPEGLLTIPLTTTKTIEKLAPKESQTFTWNIVAPVQDDNSNYTWSVQANSDDFAVGVICNAQDSFQVPGKASADYAFQWNRDNYSFINTDSQFGSTYYISNTDLNALIKSMKQTEITRAAEFYANGATTAEQRRNLYLNNMQDWGGSCYGMSVTADLFLNRLITPALFGSDTVYGLPAPNNKNTDVESFINYYHLSQATDVIIDSKTIAKIGDPDFSSIAIALANKASKIGKGGSESQPFMINLRRMKDATTSVGHAIVCYGFEEGSFLFEDQNYSRRLLIADPNKTEETYLYIADDNNSAVYSGNTLYDRFGYWKATPSELNTYSYIDSLKNFDAMLKANDLTNLIVSCASGKIALIAKKPVLIDGSFDYRLYETDDETASGDVADSNEIFVFNNETDHYTVTPETGGSPLDFDLSFDDFSIRINGIMDSATIFNDGTIELNNASDEISVDLSSNNTIFDFLTVTGKANGDVLLKLEDSQLLINGELSGYHVDSMTLDGINSTIGIHSNQDVSIRMNSDQVVAYIDTDDDDNYETELLVSEDDHIYTYIDNRNGTHTGVCYAGDSTITENHHYVNGVCDKCGAKQPSNGGGGGGSTYITKYTLSFESNGGTKIESLKEKSGHSINLNSYIPEKEGYSFEGWFLDKELTQKVKEIKLEKDLTIYAKWNKVLSDKEVCPLDDSCPISQFTDTDKTQWYHDGVHWALAKGVMNGTGENTFEPMIATSRAMIVTMLWRMEGSPQVENKVSFQDVSDDMWYTDAVRWAAARGIVNGYSEDTFAPNDNITREQIVTILYRYAQFKGIDITSGESTPLKDFSDVRDISDWATSAFRWAVDTGVIQGMTETTLNPKGSAVRAQVATMLMRFSNIAK